MKRKKGEIKYWKTKQYKEALKTVLEIRRSNDREYEYNEQQRILSEERNLTGGDIGWDAHEC